LQNKLKLLIMAKGFPSPKKVKKVYQLPKQGVKAIFLKTTPTDILMARIWGWLLGDSSISEYRESAMHPGLFVAILRFTHGEDQKEYIFSKRKMLGQYTTMGINIYTPKERDKDQYTFSTITYPWIGELYPIWYTDWYNKKTGETHNIKVVSWNSGIWFKLTPYSLSSWMADDGHRAKKSNYALSTGELPLPCLALLRGVLEEKFGVITTCNRYKDRGSYISAIGLTKYQLRVVAGSIGRFQELFEPSLHRSLRPSKLIFPFGGDPKGVYAHPIAKNAPKDPTEGDLHLTLLCVKKGYDPIGPSSIIHIDMKYWNGTEPLYIRPQKKKQKVSNSPRQSLRAYYAEYHAVCLAEFSEFLREGIFPAQLVDALAKVAHFYQLRAEQVALSGQELNANKLAQKAADYWKEAIRLAPSNFPAAQNWLKSTGRA
jgi:hypothetical protein